MAAAEEPTVAELQARVAELEGELDATRELLRERVEEVALLKQKLLTQTVPAAADVFARSTSEVEFDDDDHGMLQQLAQLQAEVETVSGLTLQAEDADITKRLRTLRDEAELIQRAKELKVISSLQKQDEAEGSVIKKVAAPEIDLSWDDIAGSEALRSALRKNIDQGKHVLIYGPSGTGKSIIANLLGREVSQNYVSVSFSDMHSKLASGVDDALVEVFMQAQAKGPSVVFLDELELVSTVCKDPAAVQELLLGYLGDSQSSVLLIAATNKPWLVPEHLARAFSSHVPLSLPDKDTRGKLFQLLLGDDSGVTAAEYDSFAEKTEGFSCADISRLCRDALMEPVRRLQFATHFVQTPDGKWKPAKESAEGAVAKSWRDLEPESIVTGSVKTADVIAAIGRSTPLQATDELQRMDSWAQKLQ